MSRIIIVSLFLHIFSIKNCLPQSYTSQQAQILTYNILLNGIIGGVGGAINKNKEEKLYIVFAKNFLAGCLGGSIKYAAKYYAYNMSYNRAFRNDQMFIWNAWSDRFIYFAGHSIVYNASLNKKPWESFQVNIYGINLYYSITDRHFQPKLSLSTIGSLIWFGIQGHTFDLRNSLNYGMYHFKMSESTYNFGAAGYNTIALKESYLKDTPAITHEFIHVFQFADYFPISSFFFKPLKKFKSHKLIKPLDTYVLFDLPYMGLFYALQPKPWYFKNFYEFEAQHFAIRRFVER